MPRNAGLRWAVLGLSLAGSQLAQSQLPPPERAPLGVYAKVSIEDALNSFKNDTKGAHGQLRKLFNDLLSNNAISGLTVGRHWDNISLSKPNPSKDGPPVIFDRYDWSYLDDAFDVAKQNNATVQLIITPGFDTPQWVLAQIPSCDSLLYDQPVSPDCGTARFTGFRQHRRADTNVVPLPWDRTYQDAWVSFLEDLNARYGTNPAFVAIAVAGPTGASTEMIYPTSDNTTRRQPSGLSVDSVWTDLVNFAFPDNQNSNYAFVTSWDRVLHEYERIFTGVTLIVSPDKGNDMPEVGPPPVVSDPLYSQDCSRDVMTPVSCQTKVSILVDFLAATGPNRKATQVGGMSASTELAEGNIGVPGVKVLTSRSTVPFPPILGGAAFDHPASGANMQRQGCPTYPVKCDTLTAELAAYNTLAVFFNQTAVQTYYNGKGIPANPKPMHYLDVNYPDVQYAMDPAHQCPPKRPVTGLGNTSMQDLLNHAKSDLFAIAGVNVPLPTQTCPQ